MIFPKGLMIKNKNYLAIPLNSPHPAAALVLDGLALTPAIVSTCAVLIGLAAGAELDLMAFLSSRYFGLRRYASIYAVTFVFFSVSAGIAPATFGMVYDIAGSYAPALRAAAVACVLGALLMLTLGAYPDFTTAEQAREGERDE